MAYLNWLKRISELVLKTIEDYGDVPGGALPVINLLIDVAKWDQKRALKPKIIQNLCQKHSINPDTVNSIEDLIAKGVPENEIEAIYSRAIAKIDNSSIVRFLEAQQSDLVQEITKHFSQLSLFLKGPYTLLQPAERVLENPPSRNTFTEPVFFRKTGPVFADFAGGKVVVRAEVEEGIKQLIQNKAFLLVGVAATGKTVIVRNICYEWIKKGWAAKFIELKKEPAELEKLVEETAKFAQEESDALIVIEDAHLNPQLINRYLERRLPTWPMLLITSRTAKFSIHAESTNHLEVLSKIELMVYDPADAIIDLYLKDKKDQGWKIDSELKRKIKDTAQKSLWVLSYALKSLDATKARAIDKMVILDEVEKDLQSLERVPSSLQETTKQLFIPILVTLSNLFRAEISTDVRFLHHWLTSSNELEINVALKALESMGEIVRTKKNQTTLYGLPHSSLADLYFEYAKGSIYERYVDDQKMILDYLVSDQAANKFEPCFPIIYTKFGHRTFIEVYTPSIIEKFDKVRLAKYISQSQSIIDARLAIKSIYDASSMAGIELIRLVDKKRLADNISKDQNLFDAGWAIKNIHEVSSAAGNELWSFIDKNKMADNIAQCQNPSDAGWAIKSIYEASVVAGNELWSLINKKKLADNIAQCKDPSETRWAIKSIHEVNSVAGLEVVSLIDKQRLADNISKCKDLSYCGWAIKSIYEVSSEAGINLVNLIDKERLADNIVQCEDLIITVWAIEKICEISPEDGLELLSIIDKKKLADSIAQHHDLSDTAWAIERIYEISSKDGLELVSLIDKKRLAHNLSQFQDLTNTASAIERIYEISSKDGLELVNLIDKKRLAHNLSQFQDLSETGYTIKVIHNINSEAGKEIVSLIDKKRLSDNIAQCRYPSNAVRAIISIYEISSKAGIEIWNLIDKKRLAENITKNENLSRIKYTLNAIYSINSDAGKELTSLLDNKRLAESIAQDKHKLYAGSIKKAFREISLEAESKLQQHIDKLKSAKQKSSSK